MPPSLPVPNVPFLDPITKAVHVQWENFFLSIQNMVPGTLPPVDARYVTTTSDPTLTNEINLGALASGLLRMTVAAGIATLSSLVFPGGITVFLRGDGTFAVPAASAGDVVGPASSVDDRVATFNGITGTIIQDGGKTIADVEADAVSAAITAATAAIVPIDLTTDVTGDLPYAHVTPATAASRVLVRGSAGGAGDWEEGTLGAGLALTGTVLDVTGASAAHILANGSTAEVASGADTYLTGSLLTIGGRLKTGSVLTWRLIMTKTAAGTAAPVYSVRFGTAGAIGDTAQLTFTGTLQTAATDSGWAELTAVIVGVSATGTVTATHYFTHGGTSTGLQNVAQNRFQTATSGTFDLTGGTLKAGVSVNPGASSVWTFPVVSAQATNLA